MSHVYRAETIIAATPERVWAVLADLDRYPDWNPFTVRARGRLEVGAPVDLIVQLGRGKPTRQRQIVREVVPGQRLTWGMRAGPWVHAQRVQALESLEDGRRTRYTTEDRIGGWLSPLVHRIHAANLDRGFSELTVALREWCEARDSTTPPKH